jgi:hypothetical protein
VRYVQQPTEVAAGAPLDPRVRVEIIDAFGNRTDAAADNLPAEAWKALGADGSTGFKFTGAVCNVVLKATTLKARCSKTGTLAVPESGPLQAVLSIGTATRYCGACGGRPKGQAARVFKRKACAAPAACP